MPTFVDNSTVIQAVWLNSVDTAVTQAIGTGTIAPTTPAEVKVNLGLDQVNNTSDVNKPISTATQIVLDTKISDASTDILTNKSISLTTNTITTTVAELNTAITDGNILTTTGIDTLTNKTIDYASNTLTGVVGIDATQTLTNKTLTAPKLSAAQIGVSGTATNNFSFEPTTAGAMKLARGNAGATTQDVMTVDASGKVNFPVGVLIGGSSVVERGSNANGQYTKFSDGTLIAKTLPAGITGVAAGSAFGASLYAHVITWTYPITFLETPVVVGSGGDTSSVGLVTGYSAATASAVCSIVTPTAAANNATLYLLAVGRWK